VVDLSYCLVADGRIYGYDEASDKCVEFMLVPKHDSKVPEEAKEAIAMRRIAERSQEEGEG